MSLDNRPIMVAIRCITYNHKPYIRQCLEVITEDKHNNILLFPTNNL